MSNEKNINSSSLLEKALLASVVEQRRQRRWSIFFKLIGLTFFILFLMLLFSGEKSSPIAEGDKTRSHVAMIEVSGSIDFKGLANASDIIKGLNQAFKSHNVKGIILHINSPGGSPVEASDIYNEVLRLRAKDTTKKIYVVCGDICASAAYYIASAADSIYANPLSLVGSIGVIMDGFGFTGAMGKVGVERRLFTAGDRKSFLDPFSPLKKEDEAYAKELLTVVHQKFIQDVQKGRGNRLKSNPLLFSGLIWTGLQALPLGLIDGYGSVRSVARDLFKTTNIVDYTYYPGYFEVLANQLKAFFPQEFSSYGATSLKARV